MDPATGLRATVVEVLCAPCFGGRGHALRYTHLMPIELRPTFTCDDCGVSLKDMAPEEAHLILQANRARWRADGVAGR